jgi:hypothetical protein
MDMLRLERKDEQDSGIINAHISMTPAIGEDYWAYRVIVGEHQAILGFPKFSTIGIGFAVEEDWNTNLPYTCTTDEIWEHIRHNKGDERIPDEWCLTAIRMVQEAATADRDTAQTGRQAKGGDNA